MPQLGEPPNTQSVTDRTGRITLAWAQWFTQAWRTIAPERAFYIPTSAGAPTFTPEARAGFVAMAYDTTNNRIYVYNGAWKLVALS